MANPAVGYTYISAPGGSGNQGCVPTDFYVATLGPAAVWSPDGRYLLLPGDESAPIAVGAMGRLPAPASAASGVAQACASPQPAPQWAHLPMRDARMATALNLAAPYPFPTLELAWTADGQQLAALTSGPPFLTILGGSAGQDITQLDINHFEPGNFVTNTPNLDPPSWSPGGSRLLLTDSGDRHVSMLGPQSLHG